MRFMDVRETVICCAPSYVTRSGYTGEDGFEISVPVEKSGRDREGAARHGGRRADRAGVRLIAARGGLRRCLDLDEATTPVEADLSWAIRKVRRRGGARGGGFPGEGTILAELETGPKRLRVGLKPQGRAPCALAAAGIRRRDGRRPRRPRDLRRVFPKSRRANLDRLPAGFARQARHLHLSRAARPKAPAEVVALPFVLRSSSVLADSPSIHGRRDLSLKIHCRS